MGTIISRTEQPLGVTNQELSATTNSNDDEAEARKRQHEEDMRKFKEELAAKREARKEAIASLNRRIEEMKDELEREREDKRRLEALLEDGRDGKAEVAGLEKQVKALKDVAAIGGEMLRIRELQVNELKNKLKAIEETGIQYEKEVDNMRKLKGLYEERSRAMTISHQMEIEREKTKVVAAETRLEIADEKNRELQDKNRELQDRISGLDTIVDNNNNEISDLRIQLAGKRDELYNVTQQMAIINNLFTQVLSDPENLDRVTRVLEEHHDLVNHLTEKGDINDVASVLMTVADKDHILTEDEKDVASNLSKVWRLLVELLGHHSKQTTGDPMPESCYKSIDTPSGPKLVISVSQTFLRLKDLILEKNCLVKEVGRLKDLNTHLEKRLISQESRLAEVADELHKTWGVVNKLKTQHKALHTHEQVLRYELKHKRLMLNELKEQLEDCREMWQMARTKNNQTEKDWKLLRKEFADRKQQISSAESGYEESPGDSQDEEDSHRLSDDESEIQELPTVESCGLRINRIDNLQLSSPERSNTPDLSDIEFPASEDTSSVQENIERNVGQLTSPVETESSSPSSRIIVTVESACSQEYPEETFVQTRTPLTPHLSSIPEEITLEIEPTIQILPWNDSNPEETNFQLEEILGERTTNLSEDNMSSESEVSSVRTNSESANCMSTSDVENNASSMNNHILSKSSSTETNSISAEERLARREVRLKRLEEQCKNLFCKMSDTNKRSDLIKNKLVELHEHYGDGKNETPTTEGIDSPTPSSSSSTNIQNHLEEVQRPEEYNATTAIPENPTGNQTTHKDTNEQIEEQV